MPRTTAKSVLALLAGVAFIGAAAQAEAGSTTPPLVLDSAALDAVTAGNYAVGTQVWGLAQAFGTPGNAEVEYILAAEGNETFGASFGLVGALGNSIGGGASNVETEAQATGDVRYVRSFGKAFNGVSYSGSIAWAASFGDLQIPLQN